VAIAIIQRDERVLICRRKSTDSFAGYWEFPGGKLEAGEEPAACIVREIREELALTIRPTRLLDIIDHDYPRVRIRLHPFLAEIEAGEPQAIECSELRWVLPGALRSYRFPGANQKFIAEVLRLMGVPEGPSNRGRRGRKLRRRGVCGEAAAGDCMPPLKADNASGSPPTE
jgi:mutator protein MutT